MQPKEFKEMILTRDLLEVPYILSRLEKQIFDMKHLGISRTKSSKLERTIQKRNIARKRLLSLLDDWRDNNYQSKELTYSDTIERIEEKKQRKSDIINNESKNE